MQAEYAMAENTVSGWLSQQVTHVSGPHSASANTIELRTLGIGVSCSSLKRILTDKCRAGDHVTSGHVIQRPRTVTTVRVSMDKITQAYTLPCFKEVVFFLIYK